MGPRDLQFSDVNCNRETYRIITLIDLKKRKVQVTSLTYVIPALFHPLMIILWPLEVVERKDVKLEKHVKLARRGSRASQGGGGGVHITFFPTKFSLCSRVS